MELHDRRGIDAQELRLKLSRATYYALGSPARLDVQRVGGALILKEANGDAGYAVTVTVGGVSINASGARDLIALDAGRYAVDMRGGRLIVGERKEP